MTRIAYVNGRYVPHGQAAVHIEDRGYQFADGVYEVIAIHQGNMVDEKGHLDRLDHSLGELQIAWPMSRQSLQVVMREMILRNRITNGMIYFQISRGVATRNHAFPDDTESALVMTVRHSPPLDQTAAAVTGVNVITIPDIRWARRDIKSISLLPNVLGKQQASEAGAYEAWMIDGDGNITEGTSSNAWIVNKDGDLITRDASHAILNGITRLAVLDLARAEGVTFVERPFDVAEAKDAREAFVTSTTSLVKPVVRIDGDPVGNGGIGMLTAKILSFYTDHMKAQGSAV